MLKKLINAIRDRFRKSTLTTTAMGSGYSGGSDYGSGAKWPGGMSAVSGRITIHDHFTVRQNARDAMYDSTMAKSMVDRFADTVVETGMRLKPTPDPDILAIDPQAAEEWAETVAGAFHLWAKSKKSHRPRVNNFYQNQRLYQVFQQRDNDIFVRLYYSREKDLSSPLQIDFVDPNQIRGHSFTSTYTQFPGDDGIIRDAGGREIGYKIWYYDAQAGYREMSVPATGEKSGRIMMLHGFNPEYAGQGRGMSRLVHVLQEFENLTDFTTSTIKKAIAQSSITMAVENEQQDSSNPLEGRVAGPVREYGSYPQPDPVAQNVTAESIGPINYQPMPEATISVPGSVGVFNLRRGDKMKYLADTSPSAQFDSFVNSFTSYLAASNGMPIELLLMKFNANYSASRAALIMFWRVAQIWRDEMAADFLDPVYEMWLSEEIAAGRISCPGWSDYRLRAAWLCCEWAGCPMPSIDPLKSMQASKLAVELSAETLDDVARDYNGSSGKANRAKNARMFEEWPTPPWNEIPVQAAPKKDEESEEE